MGAKVFANGLEISGKASDVNTMGAMPDVCLSPPSPPAGPVPIPYPNFSQASDTTDGSKTVKIGGREVGLKGKSSYKKSKGDEAATRSFGASVVSHTIQGAVKHQAGSMNVKVEGSNVCRFGDLTSGNHSNSGMPVVPGAGAPAVGEADADCAALEEAVGKKDDEIEKKLEGQCVSQEAKKNARESHMGKTVTASKSTCGGVTKHTPAYSSLSKLEEGNKNGLAPGLGKKESGEREESKICKKNGAPYKHPTHGFMNGCHHTEGRLIEDLFKEHDGVPPPGCELVMRIRWKQRRKVEGGWKPDGTKDYPCDLCKQTICHASETCGLIIKLCQGEPPEKKDPEFCDGKGNVK